MFPIRRMKWRFGTSHVAEVFCTDAASSCAGAGIPSTFDNTPKSVTPSDGSSLDGRHSSLVMQIAYRFIEGGMVSPRVKGFHNRLTASDGSVRLNARDVHPLRDAYVDERR